MRYDLTDLSGASLEPVLPGRTTAPWRDILSAMGQYTTAYNRFNRWCTLGVARPASPTSGTGISRAIEY
jgi:transposase